MQRNILDFKVYKKLQNLFLFYKKNKEEISYQSHYERKYTRNFCRYLNYKNGYADAVNSGTNALYIACRVFLKNPSKDEVIFPPVTNLGTLSAVLLAGFKKIKLCDSEETSFQISFEKLKKKINSNTRLVILSHIGGIAPKMNLREITKKYPKIRFIEDCSQSHGDM